MLAFSLVSIFLVVYCTDACGGNFNFIEATSFPRTMSSPCITVPPPAPPVLRQPRDEPEVLAHRGSKVKDDVMDARRQPRASNASLASLTVRRPHESLSNSTASSIKNTDGTKTLC